MEKSQEYIENPHLYQKSYTDEEIDDLLQWFEAHEGQLPDTLRLNASTVSEDLKKTVRSYRKVITSHRDNLPELYNNYVSTLRVIQLRLKEQGLE